MLSAAQFGPDFHWGVSTSAFQTEGAHNVDGKGPSIWDNFVVRKRLFKGHVPHATADFYKRYAEDIGLLAGLGVPNFRCSVAWSRVLPEGVGRVNRKGLDFYNSIVDTCLEHGITPWVTLYHWDLPQALEKKGGWTNRDVVSWFREYTELCATALGDRVKHWMVLNEPLVFTGAGYFLGLHAPGRRGFSNFLPAVHHAALSQAEGFRVLKFHQPEAFVGSTFSCSYVTPASERKQDVSAARRVDALLNRLFLEPSLGLGYPVRELPMLKRLEKYRKADDDHSIKANFDFIGLQNYTREVVRSSWLTPYLGAQLVPADRRSVRRTVMNWEVYPQAIYQMLKQFSAYQGVKKIIITENGAAFNDRLHNNAVMDFERIEYYRKHLTQVLRAKLEGHKVNGYFIWSLTDNFEWAEGFRPRFGLVYIDYPSQRRIPKSSSRWYSEFLNPREH